MAFTYNPKDAKDCLEAGSYDGYLESVEEQKTGPGSKNPGQPMLKVVWKVPFGDKDWPVREYIGAWNLWKLKRIAMAWRMAQDFESGAFNLVEHIGTPIVLELTVSTHEKYGDQNEIVRYHESAGLPPREAKAPTGKEDYVPFAWIGPVIAMASSFLFS